MAPITITTNAQPCLGTYVPITITMGYNADGERSRYTVVATGTTILDEHFQYRDGALAQVSVPVASSVPDCSGGMQASAPYTDTYLYDPQGDPLELIRQQGGTHRYWYQTDGQGNVVALTDSTGKVVDRYLYDPWGELLPYGVSESVPQQLRYRGYWWDSELSWYWVSVRSYDPEGRWMQPDPSEADGVHTHVYVGDDPIDLSDPSGLLTCSGSHDVFSFLGDVACHAGNFAGDVGQGAWSGVTDTWTGLVSLGQGVANSTVAFFYDRRAFQNQWQANAAVASYIAHHPLEAGKSIVIGIVAPCVNTIRSGNVGRAVGRCGFDLVMLVGGTKGITKLSRLALTRLKWFRVFVPQKAFDVLRYVQTHGWSPPPGFVGGKVFKNYEGLLPRGGTYREFDVDLKPPLGISRNAERVIVDLNTGKAWYTWNHYKSFIRIH